MVRHKPHIRVEHNSLHWHRSGEGILTLNRHTAGGLSKLLIENSRLRGDLLSPRQQEALKDFQRQEILDLNKATAYQRADVLRAYFRFFDEMFFFGTLKPRCGLLFLTREVFRTRGGGHIACSGMTRKRDKLERMFRGDRKQLVVLTLYLMKKEVGMRKPALEDYCGTLLHEMIHCFLQCWACDYDGCSNAKMVLGGSHGPVCK